MRNTESISDFVTVIQILALVQNLHHTLLFFLSVGIVNEEHREHFRLCNCDSNCNLGSKLTSHSSYVRMLS